MQYKFSSRTSNSQVAYRQQRDKLFPIMNIKSETSVNYANIISMCDVLSYIIYEMDDMVTRLNSKQMQRVKRLTVRCSPPLHYLIQYPNLGSEKISFFHFFSFSILLRKPVGFNKTSYYLLHQGRLGYLFLTCFALEWDKHRYISVHSHNYEDYKLSNN